MGRKHPKQKTPHRVNLLRPAQTHKRRPRWKVWGSVAAIVLLCGVLGVVSYQRVRSIEQEARTGEAHFREAQSRALSLDFSAAKIETDAAITSFSTASSRIGFLRLFRFIPYFGRQISAADNLIIVARETGGAVREILDIADAALSRLTENAELTPSTLTAAEREQILGALADGRDSLTRAEDHLRDAQKAYKKIPSSGLAGPLADITGQLSEQFPLIESAISSALPLTRVLPHIAGYPDGITYLFLLQNNQELRPTGGFIGTYGIISMQNAEIQSFSTDNVYNLDEAAKNTVTRTPPQPLIDYLAADKWFFRDVNWSPDFPTTARRAMEFYADEAAEPQDLDGVVAMTPVVLRDLLGITGPITVDGVVFSEENAITELRYQVDQGFLVRGEVGNERKDIIGRLGEQLVAKLENLPQKQWPALWTVFINNIERRHILMYFNDPISESVFHQQHWDGALVETDGDYLQIVDANLASLKTDSVIQRSISHAFAMETGEATVRVQYTHTADFSQNITRYRTFVRLFVPEGSTLVSSSGFMTNDKLHNGKPADAVYSVEDGHTVFSGFLSVEPETSETITVTYRIPETLRKTLQKDGYTIYIQKQAGVEQADLTSTINLGKTIAHAEPAADVQNREKGQVTFAVPFVEDAFLSVK